MVHRRAETGEQSANAVDCILLLSPFLPFTACVRSLSMVLRWEGVGLLLLFAATAAVIVRFEGKYSAIAGLVHAFDLWQRYV